MPKVNVVVPVYKVSEYLSECINSVLEQTMQDFQLILVDDGSPDDCPELCDRFAEEDNRIQVIHKENGGLSSARNAAYSSICGDFVFFLDGDDWLAPTALETLLSLQEKQNADVVIGNCWYSYEDHEDEAAQPSGRATLSGYDALKFLVEGKIQNFAWGKLIRSTIAVKYLFPEGKLFEDHYWTHHILADAKTVEITETPLLHYRQRSSSISYSYTLKRLDMVDGWTSRIAFLKENYPELAGAYLRTVSENYSNIAWLVCTRMKSERNTAIGILRTFSRKYDLSKYADKKTAEKIRLFEKSSLLFLIQAVCLRVIKR